MHRRESEVIILGIYTFNFVDVYLMRGMNSFSICNTDLGLDYYPIWKIYVHLDIELENMYAL